MKSRGITKIITTQLSCHVGENVNSKAELGRNQRSLKGSRLHPLQSMNVYIKYHGNQPSTATLFKSRCCMLKDENHQWISL